MHTHMSVCIYTQGFLGGAVVKNLSTMQETQEIPVQSLGQEDPMRRAWQPTPVFLPEQSHGQRSLEGYRPWGHKESDTIEQLSTTQTFENIFMFA